MATGAPYDLIIIGGGIVGMSTALNITRRFPPLRLLVVEKEHILAAHQSGHNSGVLHSGIYYKPGSLRAKLCVEGRAAMVEFCQEHGIPHQLCGKVVVATNQGEVSRLEAIYQRGLANGVPHIAMIGREEMLEYEPHCRGALRAMLVPVAGITDYAMVTRKYAHLVTTAGGEVRTSAAVTGLARRGGETVVETTAGAFSCRVAIVCAGLHADRLARLSGVRDGMQVMPFRGEFYELAVEKQHLVRGLIYPVPDPRFPFLGVHFTRKVHGGVEAGPNAVLAWKREGYKRTDFDLRDTWGNMTYPGFWRMAARHWRKGFEEQYRSWSKGSFYRALRRMVPDLQEKDIHPAGSGVRAQLLDPQGNLVDDFHFVPTEGILHVLNVPSPAATASLVVGREIVNLLAESYDLRTKN